MRKLFRFKYEPCNGLCYAYDEPLRWALQEQSRENRQAVVQTMVAAHDRLCDNPDYSFGVDVCEDLKIYVAHFRTPEFTHTYASADFVECVTQVCADVMSADIPQVAGACIYGVRGEENLGEEILRFCSAA